MGAAAASVRRSQGSVLHTLKSWLSSDDNGLPLLTAPDSSLQARDPQS